MNNKKQYLIPFILVTSLFFLWAFLHNLNPILIPHLKKPVSSLIPNQLILIQQYTLGIF